MELLNIIRIEDILVRQEITDTYFACDLEKCKGACCTLESEFGAPINEEEVKIIAGLLPVIRKYLPSEHIREIENNGFFISKSNELLTQTVGRKACVFVFYENDVAKCSIERAYINDETDFRKPISCHLFPIRVSKFGDEVLRYEKFSECSTALENGTKMDVTIAEFCKESLIRAYGKRWYSSLMKENGK